MAAHPNERIGRAWVDAFNARDLDALLALYAEDAHHTSPKIRALRPQTDGKIHGRAALRDWWADAYARLPELRYELMSVTASDERVIIEYARHLPAEPPMPVAELFEIRDGKIAASRVYHG